MSAGTSVIDRSATPTRANVLVYASGWNIFPSRPERAKTGRNERIVIRTEKKIGRPTVRHARMTISVVSPVTRSRPKWRVRWWAAFSPMTTAWSIRMPDADRDPRQAHDVRRHPEQPHHQEAEQDRHRQRDRTTKALPRCPITRRMAIVQTISSSLTVPLTVSMRLVDQRGAVVERDDPHALGQPGLEGRDLLLDPARDLQRVLAVAHQHHAADDLLAVLLQDAAAEGRARPGPCRACRRRSACRSRAGRRRSRGCRRCSRSSRRSGSGTRRSPGG